MRFRIKPGYYWNSGTLHGRGKMCYHAEKYGQNTELLFGTS
jgi:hypothetical protein